ncbi:MAG: ATP-binding protein [Cyanobacteria bacterium P01_G01_bin.38]
MSLNVSKFFKACNPSKTLMVGRPEDRQYYIDFSPVRDSNIIHQLERTITLSEDEPNCQLFTGHIGSGKSTELLRLKTDLEQKDFYVVYFESNKALDIGDVDISDILLAIALHVTKSLEEAQLHPYLGGFADLFAELAKKIPSLDLGFEAELSVIIGKITAKTKDSPELRKSLRQYLEPRTNNLLDAMNRELLEPTQKRLKQQGKKGLVVIIDNLDRIDNRPTASGRSQTEYLFIDRGDQLQQLKCHLVYTVPLSLIFSNNFGQLTNRFGIQPLLLPMVPVKSRKGDENKEGIALLQQMVLARAFPGLNSLQRIEQATEVFDSLETLKRLCCISGGHVRNLLVLLYSCLQQIDPPISRNCLEAVIKRYRGDLELSVSDEQWQLLRHISQEKMISEEPEYQALLRSLFVFEYRDKRDDRWFDINPALVESEGFKDE